MVSNVALDPWNSLPFVAPLKSKDGTSTGNHVFSLEGYCNSSKLFLKQHNNSTVDSVSTINPTVSGVIKTNSNLI